MIDKKEKQWCENINELGASGIPFLFIIDYDIKTPLCYRLDSVPSHISYALHSNNCLSKTINVKSQPITLNQYKIGFDNITKHINYGDSYLVNYTVETPIETDATLHEMYEHASAPYKLMIENSFVVFSPEPFIKIQEHGAISTFPMKGTIDATLPNAESIILGDTKEAAEHATVVDLLRNDLSKVAQNVKVKRYRYIQKIETSNSRLLQVSSEITGQLSDTWKQNIGSLLLELLPAGSVTGAPKKRTVEIINEVENHARGYYTGVFGVFDGQSLDSAVMIRFIEQRNGKLYYKSGGGITSKSNLEKEYEELIHKIYVPIG